MITAIGLQDVIVAETALSHVDGEKGHLIYRGRWAKDLALRHTFEEVAYLLWYGNLPGKEELARFRSRLAAERSLPERIKRVIDGLPESADMMSVLRTAVSALGTEGPDYPPTVDQAMSLTAKLPAIIAYRTNILRDIQPAEPREDLGHTANYLYMLRGAEASDVHIRALEAYLILTMEHGMNSSTFAARVVASTRSDIASSLTAAIGALKGPLHGGAPSLVTKMLESIGTKEQAEPWLRNALQSGERLMGFGHRIYKTIDPRAVALRQLALELAGSDPWLEMAVHTEEVTLALLKEYKPGLRLNTNVEFYAAAVMRALSLGDELFTPTFALTRAVGWCGHIMEAAQSRLIYPESSYTGEMPAE
jgi:citrate synthase